MSSFPAHPTAGDPTRQEPASYPPAALVFVREGLSYTVEQIHGPMSPAFQFLARFLEDNQLDWEDLRAMVDSGEAPPRVMSAVAMVGGSEKLNRHVRGGDLCWGLRDLAMKKWGLLARCVLEHWGIRRTIDFGRIVFAAIEAGQMQKQPSDSIEDFRDVFDFKTALDDAFRIDLGAQRD